MLFTELKKIQDDDIEQALEERLKARGLDPAILHQSLGGSDVTVEELISDVVDGLIAQAVDANRESFRARQRKGFEQAQAAGKSVGRPSRKSPAAFAQVRRMYEAHEISGAQAADLRGAARGTFYRWLKESTAEENIKDRGGGGGKNCNLLRFSPVYTEKKFEKWRPDFQPPFFDAFYYFCSDTGSLPSALAIRRLVK